VEAALEATTEDVKDALAHGLADLGGRFDEFGWILDEVRQTLTEIRTRQALQLAMQREQLDLQRQQLVKTNLILQVQQARAAVPTPAMAEEIEEVERFLGDTGSVVLCPAPNLGVEHLDQCDLRRALVAADDLWHVL